MEMEMEVRIMYLFPEKFHIHPHGSLAKDSMLGGLRIVSLCVNM